MTFISIFYVRYNFLVPHAIWMCAIIKRFVPKLDMPESNQFICNKREKNMSENLLLYGRILHCNGGILIERAKTNHRLLKFKSRDCAPRLAGAAVGVLMK